MKKIIIAALGVALAGSGMNAYAATVTGTLNTTLQVLTACTMDSSGVSGVFGKLGLGVVAYSTMVGGTSLPLS